MPSRGRHQTLTTTATTTTTRTLTTLKKSVCDKRDSRGAEDPFRAARVREARTVSGRVSFVVRPFLRPVQNFRGVATRRSLPADGGTVFALYRCVASG